MGITLVTVAVVMACAWLALSIYLGVMEAEAAVLDADYVKCSLCGRHYFAPHDGSSPHTCAGRTARLHEVLGRPARRLRHSRRAA